MEREIAVAVSNANEKVNVIDTIDAIYSAGFRNVFIQWYNRKWVPAQEEQLDYIRKKGLNVIFAHLGYQNIHDLWLDTEEGNRLTERYRQDIKICKDNGIPMVVMHLTAKKQLSGYNETGLKRLREIVDYAKALSVKVAFENTVFQGYLDYVIENIGNDNVGICFDSGHCHLYFKDEFPFEKFRDRVFAVHFHDNDRSGDQHLLPFDGTIDWTKIVNDLKGCGYSGPVTMEPCYRQSYLEMGVDDFYKKAYEAGERLRTMFL